MILLGFKVFIYGDPVVSQGGTHTHGCHRKFLCLFCLAGSCYNHLALRKKCHHINHCKKCVEASKQPVPAESTPPHLRASSKDSNLPPKVVNEVSISSTKAKSVP
ncbi:hypothetical protein E2542_SST14620 [Spatholobus suberectus]|nr:hypothetical protein E2542_SST14620 [Spatholobus suberectus]